MAIASTPSLNASSRPFVIPNRPQPAPVEGYSPHRSRRATSGDCRASMPGLPRFLPSIPDDGRGAGPRRGPRPEGESDGTAEEPTRARVRVAAPSLPSVAALAATALQPRRPARSRLRSTSDRSSGPSRRAPRRRPVRAPSATGSCGCSATRCTRAATRSARRTRPGSAERPAPPKSCGAEFIPLTPAERAAWHAGNDRIAVWPIERGPDRARRRPRSSSRGTTWRARSYVPLGLGRRDRLRGGDRRRDPGRSRCRDGRSVTRCASGGRVFAYACERIGAGSPSACKVARAAARVR